METGVQDIAFSGKLARDRAGCVGTWGAKCFRISVFLLIQIEMFYKLAAQASPVFSPVIVLFLVMILFQSLADRGFVICLIVRANNSY